MRRAARGFTLIEALIVVAMISIMLALAVPSFRKFISNYRVTTAANDFLQGVTATRTEALKRGRRVIMMPNDASGVATPGGSWSNGWTIFVDTNANYAHDANEDLISHHEVLPSSITTVNAASGSGQAFVDSGANSYISFDGTGYPRQIPTSAVIKGGIQFIDTTMGAANPSVRTVCLALLGRARVVSAADSCNNGEG